MRFLSVLCSPIGCLLNYLLFLHSPLSLVQASYLSFLLFFFGFSLFSGFYVTFCAGLCLTPFEIRGSLPSSFRVAHWKMILTPHWHLWILQKWAFLLVRKFYLWVTHPLTFKQKNEEKKSLMHTVCIFATVSSLLYSCLAFHFPSSLFSSGFLLIILLMSAHSSSGRLSLALPAESLVCCFDSCGESPRWQNQYIQLCNYSHKNINFTAW